MTIHFCLICTGLVAAKAAQFFCEYISHRLRTDGSLVQCLCEKANSSSVKLYINHVLNTHNHIEPQRMPATFFIFMCECTKRIEN